MIKEYLRDKKNVFHHRDLKSKLYTYFGIFSPDNKIIRTYFDVCTCQKCLKKVIRNEKISIGQF